MTTHNCSWHHSPSNIPFQCFQSFYSPYTQKATSCKLNKYTIFFLNNATQPTILQGPARLHLKYVIIPPSDLWKSMCNELLLGLEIVMKQREEQ